MSFITGSGLVSYSNALNSTAPNNVIPVASFVAIGGAANIDAALVPKGNGALLAQIPTGTAAGGNKRGGQAVDWQGVRAIASQVATGDNSVIGGGRANTAVSQYCTVGGGSENIATGVAATVGGGSLNTADQVNATVPGGQGATTRGVQGALAYAGNGQGNILRQGFSQYRDIVYRATTADATVTPLTTNNGGVESATVSAFIPDQTCAAFDGLVVAINTATDASHAWRIQGVLRRGVGVGTTTLLGSSITDLGSDAAAAAWAVTLAANAAIGCLTINVQGAAATGINWSASIRFAEVMRA